MEAWQMAMGKGSLTGLYHAWSLSNVTPDPENAEQKPITIITNAMFTIDCYS